METWSSTNGHSFQGKYVSFQGGKVRLQGADGKLIDVTIALLDEESKARVYEYSGQAGIANPLLEHSTPSIDVQFGESPGREYLQLRMKRGGQEIPFYGAINVRFGASEVVYNKKDGRKSRKSMRLEEIVTESVNKGKGTFRLKYDKGLETLVTVDCETDGVVFSYTIDVLPASVEAGQISSGFAYPAILEFDKPTKLYSGPFSKEPIAFKDFDRLFAGYVATATKKNQKTSFTFDESPKGLSGERMAFTTPGNKDIVVQAIDRGVVKTSFYGGKKMVEGFGVGFSHTAGKNAAVGQGFKYRIGF